MHKGDSSKGNALSNKNHKISGRVPEILYFNRGRNIIFILIKMIFRKRKRPMRKGRPMGEPVAGSPIERVDFIDTLTPARIQCRDCVLWAGDAQYLIIPP